MKKGYEKPKSILEVGEMKRKASGKFERLGLETHLSRPGVPDIEPFVGTKPLTDIFIKKARREGRA